MYRLVADVALDPRVPNYEVPVADRAVIEDDRTVAGFAERFASLAVDVTSATGDKNVSQYFVLGNAT